MIKLLNVEETVEGKWLETEDFLKKGKKRRRKTV